MYIGYGLDRGTAIRIFAILQLTLAGYVHVRLPIKLYIYMYICVFVTGEDHGNAFYLMTLLV